MMTKNKLLAKLPRHELEIVSPDLEAVQLSLGQTLHGPLETIKHAVFVDRGVFRWSTSRKATIGPEGMVGFPVLLGARSVPSRAVVQIPGDAHRMKIADLERALPRAPGLQKLLLRFTMALLNQIAQSTSCNRLHEVQERCARWLLQTHDRVDSDTFPLTQEFLAQMLGVHRPTVTVAAAMLQKAGVIAYTRGQITVLDRRGLEAASCPCYRTIKDEYSRLLGGD